MNSSVFGSGAFQANPLRTFTFDADIVVFPQSGGRVTINQHSETEWSKVLVQRFNELTALRPGWDGYGGKPVSFTCARFAADLLQRLYDGALPPPSLVPGSDGTLQFEWHMNQYDIEVDVLAAFNVVAMRHDCTTGEIEEMELVDADFSKLAQWLSDLKLCRNAPTVLGAV
jgi:hypothetical protein